MTPSPSNSFPPLRPSADFVWDRGGIVRGPRDRKRIALVFTGGHYGKGMFTILDALEARRMKGAFFLTGDYLRISEHRDGILRLLEGGHILGPHSDRHWLYCPWDDRDTTLVAREDFENDLRKNLDDLVSLGARRESMVWWIPPYEWYNQAIVDWSIDLGLRLFNFSPGTLSHTDYTEADANNYRDSETIFRSILDFESSQTDGLNGFLLLTHVGASPKRPDTFFRRLPALLDELGARGYEFVPLDEMLAEAPLRP